MMAEFDIPTFTKNVKVGHPSAILSAQAGFRPNFFDRAVIERHDADVTVTANYPLPLYQALAAIQGEYGWRVNWESAPGFTTASVFMPTTTDPPRYSRISLPRKPFAADPACGNSPEPLPAAR